MTPTETETEYYQRIAEYRQRLLDDLNSDYAALRSDAVAWEAEQAERRELEGTIADAMEDDDEPEDDDE